MLFVVQVFAILVCIAFLAFVVKQIGNERFLLQYALLWLALAVVILVCAIFPQPVLELSKMLGFDTASNFIFFSGLFFLIIICLILTAVVSKQAIRIKNLTQDLALLQYDVTKETELENESLQTGIIDEKENGSR